MGRKRLSATGFSIRPLFAIMYVYARICPLSDPLSQRNVTRIGSKRFFTCLCPIISFFLFQTQRRRGAECFPFEKENIESAEHWPANQPMADLKNARKAFYSPSLS